MKLEYAITYLACQSCTAKIHCEKCAAELTERLQKQRGVSDVQIDIPARRMSLQTDGLDEMDLLDMLEDAGIFAG